jgi:VIT1/CCC1 family predicted Fe2+/Mn2+ transporter
MTDLNVQAAEPADARPAAVVVHADEPHAVGLAVRLNWLRAGVLGANDGIVSTAGLVVGVAGATTARSSILTAGVAGLVAGAVAMALGEYVSVSSQRDTERALLDKERIELAEHPERELAELATIYAAKGLSAETARAVELANPWHAVLASAVSFCLGALLPILAILLPPVSIRVPMTFAVVVLALALTGSISARVGGGNRNRAVARIVVGGALAMVATFGIGRLVGAAGL